MTEFTIHTPETAPEGSKPLLAGIQKKYGFIPNLLAEFAEAPNVLKGYLDIAGATSQGTFSPTQAQIVQITTSRLNGCHYCVAAHSTFAEMGKIEPAVIDALKAGQPLGDTKLEALRQFTEAVVKTQGWVQKSDVDAFLNAGYTQAQILEVILSVAMKVITNYTNHIVHTPVDANFKKHEVAPVRKAS